MDQLALLKQQLLAGQISYTDYVSQVTPLLQQIQSTDPLNTVIGMYYPEQVQQELVAKRQMEAQQGYSTATGLADLARQLGLGAMAVGQINASNQMLGQPAPGIPTPPSYNPQLSQALSEAQRMAGDVSYATQPVMQELRNNYLTGLQQVQAASGGQAANLTANANLLNQNLNQAALQLAPVAQGARMQNQAVVNELLGQRMNEQQRMFENQMMSNDVAQRRYNLSQQTAGQAGMMGRYNLANLIQNFKLPEYYNWLPLDDETKNVMKKAETRYAANGYGIGPDWYQDENQNPFK